MTENEHFLHAILESPDDDQLRLIYADWLEERGEARGEFIRVQIHRATLAPDSPAHLALLTREKELLAQHEQDWLGPLRLPGTHWEFQRGFVEKGAIPFWEFPLHAEQLFAQAPLRHLRFLGINHAVSWRDDDWRKLAQLAQSPYMARPIGLSFSGLNDRALRLLLDSPHLRSLRELDLESNRLSEEAIRALAGANHLTQLARLNLSYNPIGDLGAQLLAGAPRLPALQDLTLTHCAIRADGMHALAQGSLVKQLHGLNLDDNALGNTGLRHLARSARLSQLARLSLRLTQGNGIGVESLASSPYLRRLQALDLSKNQVGDRGAAALVGRGREVLQELVLRDCRISPDMQTYLKDQYGSAVYF